VRASQELLDTLDIKMSQKVSISKLIDTLLYCIIHKQDLDFLGDVLRHSYGDVYPDMDAIEVLAGDLETIDLLGHPWALNLWITLKPIVRNCLDVETVSLPLEEVQAILQCDDIHPNAFLKRLIKSLDLINDALGGELIIYKMSKGTITFCALKARWREELKLNLQKSGLQTSRLYDKYIYADS